MKAIPLVLALAALVPAGAYSQAPANADSAGVSAQMSPDGGRIVVEARGVKPKAPLFFSATAENAIRMGADEITGEIKLSIHVVQGRPEVLTFELTGGGEVTEVTGDGLRDWAVRQANGKRFLDLRPQLAEEQPGPEQLGVTIHTKIAKPAIPGSLSLPILAPGDAVGFASQVVLIPGDAVDMRVTRADGMIPLGTDASPRAEQRFYSTGEGFVDVMLSQRGAAIADAELVGASLTGKLNDSAGSVDFILTGEARVTKPGAHLPLLSGGAALSGDVSGDGWHVEWRDNQSELVFDKAGTFPIKLSFAAVLNSRDDWRWIDFHMSSGTVVPLKLDGLPDNATFDPAASVVPDEKTRMGFLAANGSAWAGWRRTRDSGEGALSFTSHEQSDVRIGAGLLRQTSQINFRVLQGKLHGVKMRIDGPGEILGVEGANVLSWKIVPDGKLRVLDVRLSRPLEKDGALVVRSQAPLGNFPVRAEPLRLTPDGVVRHSGYVRIANDGAVRLEVADVTGMMQLSPAQFPGDPVEEGARQVFVYRFPSASYAYRVVANQILPEVGVSQITVYELADTDRVIKADLELDIREAPLREWSFMIPEDYAVVGVNGAAVADYVAETAAKNGARVLKILFGSAVQGRQLVHLRLEKNQAAAAGEWKLPPLSFPGAKSVRGHVGVVSASGFRIVPASSAQLVEMPLSYFPNQLQGLQQAYRLREPDWSATIRIEALAQSVQADVFHLYSLKEGVVYGSVLINYFVIGAPSNEWRIEVPKSAGNIDVVGQNVRRDWRRDGDQIIVSLHQPVLGPATLLITFEQPMSARGGEIKPGEVRPIGVQSERGFVQVVSPLQVKSQVLKAEGLLKLEPLELPAEFRLLTSSPSLAVYQYTSRPFALDMNIDWYAPADTVDQLVDFAKLTSHISRDGQIVTDARYFVKTRGRKALRLALPEGVRLWEARTDNEIVNARVDGDQTIIPLPPRTNPNEPVEVLLRLGQISKRANAPVLNSPKAQSPTVISEWTISGDPGQLLVPKGGTAALNAPGLTETGFEWLSTRAPFVVFLLLAALAAAGWLLRERSGWKPLLGFAAAALVVIVAVHLARTSVTDRRVNKDTLAYSAPVVPAGDTVTIRVANVVAWHAMISGWGISAGVAGVALLGIGALRAWRGRARVGWPVPAGAALCTLGILAQRGGAIAFFLLMAAGVFFLLLIPALIRWLRKPGAVLQPAVATLLAAALCLGAAHAQNAKPAEMMVQSWKIHDGRLFGEIDVRVRGGSGDSFLLLNPPAVVTGFEGEGLRITKVRQGEQASYYIALERDGVFNAHVKFEMPASNLAGGLALPTGPVAVQRVTVTLDEGGWEFFSPAAVSVQALSGLAENQSGATLVLNPAVAPVLGIRAKSRDVAAEKPQYFAEAANLFIPGPGVVSGFCRVTIRPVQGQVSELELDVPKGFTVGDVGNGPVGDWRFNPETRKLRIGIVPAQARNFQFDVETQLGTEALPVDLSLEPIRVTGANGEVGMIALAFGGDAQPENVRGLSPVNLEDFDSGLIPRGPGGQPLATLQQAFRYGQEGGGIALRVAPVAPEIRVATKQVFSFGDDRLVLAADLHVSITRAGLFKLSFEMPEGLEIEAISSPALSHWTEASEDGKRVITLQLNGRTIGEQDFAMTLTGAAPAAQKEWPVPRLLLREATRQTGEIFLVPEKGIRLQAVQRENVSQLDPAAAGDSRPGALAFRLLQADWSVKLGIEALDPWVTAHALQEVTVREGQTLTRLAIRYRVDNAAVKQLRIRLADLTKSQLQTLRATGSAVSDFVKVAGEDNLWEIRFQRGIAGETDVQIEFQGEAAREQGRELVRTPVFEGVRQVSEFVAIRSSGRIEIDAGDLPRGWQRIDWSSVPADLQDRSDRSVPALCFRVAEPEGPLAVNIHRHDVADALKLRVTRGELTTLFSPGGPALTAVQLTVEVVEKSSLRVRLPKGAQLFSAFVNGESVSVVRDGDAYLLSVSPNTDTDRSAALRLVYSVPDMQGRRVDLVGPSLDVPLENVSWRMIVPPGYSVDGYKGSLRFTGRKTAGAFGLEEYENLSDAMRNSEAKKASALIEQANTFLKNGDQLLAGEVLSRAANSNAGDEAFNEDARVQLRTLKTQQAIVGLNTRRQRLYLDNAGNAANNVVHNAQLEAAASQNGIIAGNTNFDLQQVDQMLVGNTADENTALRGIADRIVEQQLGSEPAPGAIEVTLPESGKVLTFARSIQVDGDAPLTMQLSIGAARGASGWFVFLLLIAAAAAVAMAFPRRAAGMSEAA